MRRKVVQWTWEHPDAQSSFAEIVGFPDVAQTMSELDKIESLVGLHPPARILDVGCGNGRHALELARRRYDVVGIDVARRYLDEAIAEAERQHLNVEFKLQRGSELRDEHAFDFALAFYHTLGFMREEEVARHVARIRLALKPSGTLLLVFAGPRLIEGRESESTCSWSEREGKFILVERRFECGHRHERTVVVDPEADEIVEYVERQRAFALGDLEKHLTSAGFTRVDSLRSLDGGAATPEEFGVFVCHVD